jgi:hypothetical protein
MGEWLRVVRPADRTHILKTLVQLADSGDAEAGEFGTELIHMWAHGDQEVVDPALAALALNLASRPRRKTNGHRYYAWQQVLLALCSFYPRQVAEIVLGRITEPSASHERWSEQNSGILSSAAAVNPADVMEAVGNVLLDETRRVIFGVSVFHGLFEAIGLPQVKSWVEQHGIDYLRWIGRHLPSPHLDEQKRPVLPPLTDWLFREHEDDEQAFQWFLMGRHSGEAFHEGEVDPARTREEMQPFFEHELHRVREWAQYEVASAEEQAKFFREMDEEFERR